MAGTLIDKLSILDLRLLLEIDRVKSITQAGAHLNLSPSTASRMLKRIRETLGDECFAITKDDLVCTRYFDRIRPTLHGILDLSKDLSPKPFDPATTSRVFRLTCVMAEVSHVLGGVIPLMLENAPNARLDLCKNDDEFSGLFSRNADFAIVTEIDLPPDVHVMRLYSIDRVILLRRGHPLTRIRHPLELKDLMNYGRVTIRTGRTNAWTGPDQGIFPTERFMEHTRFSTTRLNTAWEAMQNSDLIAVCGWRAAEIAMRGYELTTMPLPVDADVSNPWTVLIWPDFSHHDPGCVWLRGIFSQWAKKEAQRVEELIKLGKGPPRRQTA